MSSKWFHFCCCLLFVFFVKTVSAQSIPVSTDVSEEKLIREAVEVRDALVNQYLSWGKAMRTKPKSKAVMGLSEASEPDVFRSWVSNLAYLHVSNAGPHVLEYLLQLADPASVSQDQEVVDELKKLGHSVSASVAWEIKKHQKQGGDVEWLNTLLEKLEGERADILRQSIERAPSRHKISQRAGNPIKFGSVPLLFNKQNEKRLVFDLDTDKQIEWPGPTLPEPGDMNESEEDWEKLTEKLIPTAREEHLLCLMLTKFEALILPTDKVKVLRKGLLQGSYELDGNIKQRRPFIGGPGFRKGMRLLMVLEDGRRVVFQPFNSSKKYGGLMAYVIVGKEEKNIQVAVPEDPKTVYEKHKGEREKLLAYSQLQRLQTAQYRDKREKAMKRVVESLPDDPADQIDEEIARKLNALGDLRAVHEAGRLIDWLSAEHDGTDTHPARAALAKIGTLGTARERALLDKPVTEQLLTAHETADDSEWKKRIESTLADIYGSDISQHLLKSDQAEE